MHIVATLVEGDYLFGASSLYNSLVRNGFDGEFLIGYRDLSKLPERLYQRMKVTCPNRPKITWQKLDTDWHFTNIKPQFMDNIFEVNDDVDKVTYIDPDISIVCPWKWIDSWPEHGPTICGDVNWDLPLNHPTRYEWRRLLEGASLHVHHNHRIYYNGGFVSVQRQDRVFIQRWERLMKDYGGIDNPLDAKGDIESWRRGGRWNALQAPDQDTLNMVAMTWEHEMATLGPDAMGFLPGWNLMPHAVGSAKPWRRSYLREALGGTTPRLADHTYWRYAQFPVQSYRDIVFMINFLSLKMAALIGRFYRRL